MNFRGRLAGSYWSAVLLVVCALVPFLGLSSAVGPLQTILAHGVHLSPQALQLTLGMSNAAYALGTVLGVQLAVHYPQRRLLVIYSGMFTIGSVLSATAFTPGLFIAGHVIQGLLTSMMLIAAAPALVTGWPTSRLPTTVMIMNLGIFGAVAAGPFFGGLQANAHAWRPLFWVVAGIGFAAFVLALLTFTDTPAAEPTAPRDWWAIVLAGLGCASAFFGASELETHKMLSLVTFAPLVAGVCLLVILIIHQTTARDPLMPMAQLLTTFGLPAVAIAVAAGAGSIPLIDLVSVALKGDYTPVHLGVLLLPFLGGALLTALIFGAIVRTRFIPLLAWSGLIAIAGGAAVLTGVSGGNQAIVLVGSGLVGLGVGASVAPALFTVGFTLRGRQLPRVFAMLELLRGAAAFAAGPIILHVADTTGSSKAAGLQIAIWICFAIVLCGASFSLYMFILARTRLPTPDISAWVEDGNPAWYSPPLAAGIRRPVSASSNGKDALSFRTHEAARVVAMAHAGLAHGEPIPPPRSKDDPAPRSS
jgi:MFS family permease